MDIQPFNGINGPENKGGASEITEQPHNVGFAQSVWRRTKSEGLPE